MSLSRREWFDIIVLGEESARPKPYPDPYQDALKASGTQPDEAIICEDSPSGAALESFSFAKRALSRGVTSLHYFEQSHNAVLRSVQCFSGRPSGPSKQAGIPLSAVAQC